jgi:hypothetical protein
MHREDAIFELCVYLVEISVVGQGKAAHEGAVAAFDSVILLFLLFLFKLPFARDGQHAVFDCNFYVFFSHLGQLSLDEIFLVIFGNVRQGRSFGSVTLLPSTSTVIRSASVLTLRINACSIFSFTSDGLRRGLTVIRLVTPFTRIETR